MPTPTKTLVSVFIMAVIVVGQSSAGRSVTAEEKQILLDTHNNFRRQLAKGLVVSEVTGIPYPRAGGMREMVGHCSFQVYGSYRFGTTNWPGWPKAGRTIAIRRRENRRLTRRIRTALAAKICTGRRRARST